MQQPHADGGARPIMTGGTRALLALVILMGVLIVAGTTALVAIVLHRLAHPHAPPPAALASLPAPVPGEPVGPNALPEPLQHVAEPAGTRITGLARQSDTVLAISLSGGGPDRVLLWDLAANHALVEIRLAP